MSDAGRWGRRAVARGRVAGGLAAAQLRRYRYRFLLAVVGIALAVLATTLLAGVGVGVYETGQRQFETADRDLWVTGGETRITSAGGGGFQNTVHGSRGLAAEMERHEDVERAVPLAFQSVYVGTERDGELRTFIGAGVPDAGGSLQVTAGESLPPDTHYANGTYDGQRQRAVLVDAETADALDVEVGDTVYVGGTLTAARENAFTVVGISPTFERMLGAPTVVMPLSELHEVTGTTRSEPATFITVTATEDADVDALQRDLRADYPAYEIRDNREQLEAVLREQVVVLAASATLVVLAVVTGIAMTTSVLAVVVYQQRREVAALSAQGVPPSLFVGSVVVQGSVLGLLGGGLAAAVTPPAVAGLNRLGASVVGYEGLVRADPAIALVGLGIAVGIGAVAAALAGWRVARDPPLANLR